MSPRIQGGRQRFWRCGTVPLTPQEQPFSDRDCRCGIFPIRMTCPYSRRNDPMKVSKKFLAGLLLATAVTLGTAVGNVANARDFRSADVHPKDYPTVRAVVYAGDLVKKATDGKYGIKVFGDSALGSEKDTVEQVKLGGLDMVRVNTAAFHNIVPETLVPSMPFLFRDEAHMRAVLDGPVGDEILAAFEKAGFIGLAFYDSGSRSIYAKKAGHSPADVKGMKIRVQQSDLWVSILGAMGANATPMPAAEVYTALKTGLVDAAENNYSSFQSFRHFEAAPFYSVTEHSMAPEVLVFSKKIWDGLSKNEQDIIRKAAKDSVSYMRQLWDERQAKAKADVVAGGATIVADVDKAAFQDTMKPVYDKFLSDDHLKDLANRAMAQK